MAKHSGRFVTIAGGLALCAFGQPGPAQPPSDGGAGVTQLERIEVTAQKRPQTLQQVPLAVTAYSGAFLENVGIAEFKDLALFVPGLFVQEQSPNFPGINLRGITTDDKDPRADARVSIFQDGMSISRASGSVVEFFDMERVEVLKGPQGTLFGRSAETGAISLLSRRPVDATEASLTAGAGNFSARRLAGHFNTPLGSRNLLARVAFAAVKRDGNQANLVDGSDLNGRDTVAVRPALRWAPQAGTTVDGIVNYQHDRPPGTGFKSAVIPTARGDTDPFTAAELTRGSGLGVDRTVWGATAILAHELGERVTLTATTGVRNYDSTENADIDGSRLKLFELTDDSAGRQFSQEVRLALRGNARFDGFVGANYFREQGSQRYTLASDERQFWSFFSADFRGRLAAAGVPAALLGAAVPAMSPFAPQATLPIGFAVFNTPLVPAALRSVAALAGAPLKPEHREAYTTSGRTESTDGFADGTWHVTRDLELTAGARVSFERGTTGYHAPVAAVPSTLGFLFGAGPNLGVVPTAGELTADTSATGWVGRLAARYQVTPALSTYVNVSQGRRPGTVFIGNTGVTPIREETVLNSEVGAKGVLAGGRFDYSASLFNYHYRHFQTSVRDPANSSRFIVVDAGNATGRGAELALRAQLAAAVSAFATYGYTDATFDATGANGQPQRFAGSSFRLTARHALAVGSTLRWTMPAVGELHLTPVYHYRSRQFFNDDNTRFGGSLKQEGFALVNVRAGWRAPGGRWACEVFVENALDQNYLIDAGNLGASYNIPTTIRGDPRLWGVNATMRF